MTLSRRVLGVGQVLVGLCVLVRLCSADTSEYWLRFNDRAVLDICLTGLVGSLLFAYDVPRLLANARRALLARKRFAHPFARLDALPRSGVIHTEGVCAAPVDFLQRSSFMLERRGAVAIVEVDPDRTSLIIDIEDNSHEAGATLPAGTAMRIIGEVKREDGPDAVYRGTPPRLVPPGSGPLRIYVGEAAALKRLLLAALVEIVAAVGLSASVLWFVGTIAYLEVALNR